MFKEDLNHIHSNDNSFISSIEQINFNPKYPENHNIRFKNLRSNNIEIFDDDKWHIANIKEFIKSLISSHRYKLLELIVNNNNLSDKQKDSTIIDILKYDSSKLSHKDIDRVLEKYNYDGKINMKDEYINNAFNDLKIFLYNNTKDVNNNIDDEL